MSILRSHKFYLILILVTVAMGALALCSMRYANQDESIYLLDSAGISRTLAQGQWIGNQPVGWHGFMFKLPAALIFMITGPSIFVATATTIFFSIICIILSFDLFKSALKSNWWGLAGTFLLVTNYHFINCSATFLRDIPLLMCSLLLYRALIKKGRPWIIGIILLLILDSKESVFFAFIPPILLWILLTEFIDCKTLFKTSKGLIEPVLDFCLKCTKRILFYFAPALIWLILMFCTSIIPLNMRNANILGLTTSGMHDMYFNFTPIKAVRGRETIKTEKTKDTENNKKEPQTSTIRTIKKSYTQSDIFPFRKTLSLYSNKIFFQRAFSLISCPKIIVFPIFFISLIPFIWFSKEQRRQYLPLILLAWGYSLIYVIRISTGRYLIPVLPLFILFFLYYLRETPRHIVSASIIFIITSGSMILTLYYDRAYMLPRIFISSVLIAVYLVFWLVSYYKKSKAYLAASAIIILLGIFSSVSVAVSLNQIGQIKNYKLYGKNGAIKKIATLIDQSGTNLIYGIDKSLLLFYLGEKPISAEGTWYLKDCIPKKKLLISNSSKYFSEKFVGIQYLTTAVLENNITKLCIVTSSLDSDRSRLKIMLQKCLNDEAFELQERIKLQNKVLYKFDIKIEKIKDQEKNRSASIKVLSDKY